MLGELGPGQILLADRAYDSDALRRCLTAQGAWANIKPMPNRVNIPAFSPFLYRYRNLVEPFFNKIKHFRAVATRFEKHDANYLAIIKLTAAKIYGFCGLIKLGHLEPRAPDFLARLIYNPNSVGIGWLAHDNNVVQQLAD